MFSKAFIFLSASALGTPRRAELFERLYSMISGFTTVSNPGALRAHLDPSSGPETVADTIVWWQNFFFEELSDMTDFCNSFWDMMAQQGFLDRDLPPGFQQGMLKALEQHVGTVPNAFQSIVANSLILKIGENSNFERLLSDISLSLGAKLRLTGNELSDSEYRLVLV